MSISQGNGPLINGMAIGLVPTEEQTESEKLDHLYEKADPEHASADGDGEPDLSDADDEFNNDAMKE
ncbi:MAG: hypothetical protein QOG52_969 [Frankiaceae bacterium]|jgi:hypothetical protein|nr:hypothetical protein [Frankiaceae bacterium]MDQ1723941.1 hypothetical protein [Frankiaceae bacterium]